MDIEKFVKKLLEPLINRLCGHKKSTKSQKLNI